MQEAVLGGTKGVHDWYKGRVAEFFSILSAGFKG